MTKNLCPLLQKIILEPWAEQKDSWKKGQTIDFLLDQNNKNLNCTKTLISFNPNYNCQPLIA